MLAALDIKTRRVVIISAYDPQQGCSDEEKDDFWQRLSDATQSVKEDEIVFVGGDLNGHVGSEHPSFQRNHGGLGIGTLNEDGARILDWAQAQDLALCNTFFAKRNSHLVTYSSGNHKTQIDFWACRRTDLKLVKNTKVIPFEPVASQHLPLQLITLLHALDSRQESSEGVVETNFNRLELVESHGFEAAIDKMCHEIITWTPNMMELYKCNASHEFISELASLYQGAVNDIKNIVRYLKMSTVLCQLILQKSKTSKIAINRRNIERRILLWEKKELLSLLQKANFLQMQRSNNPRSDKGYTNGWIRRFIKLMSSGNTGAATQLITASVNSGSVLRLDDRVGEQTVLQRLGDLHLNASDIHEEFCLIDHLPNATPHHPITFQDINNENIINAARRTQGSAELRKVWDAVRSIGPRFGFQVNELKCQLLSPRSLIEEVKISFKSEKIKLVTEGTKILGSAIRSDSYIKEFVRMKVDSWLATLNKLALVAREDPRVAYISLIQAIQFQRTHVQRTC
ncbi:hypothetical protein GJ496_004914 [Pomphorhynchus laevis]|nr:hypothetical protein GJ496_004914 [Pomphorhynchus laevis]